MHSPVLDSNPHPETPEVGVLIIMLKALTLLLVASMSFIVSENERFSLQSPVVADH